MFYAQSDSFTGDNPKDITAGFANTKTAIAFESKKERDEWLKQTKLTTAKAITRDQARVLAFKDYDGNRVVFLAGHNQDQRYTVAI